MCLITRRQKIPANCSGNDFERISSEKEPRMNFEDYSKQCLKSTHYSPATPRRLFIVKVVNLENGRRKML